MHPGRGGGLNAGEVAPNSTTVSAPDDGLSTGRRSQHRSAVYTARFRPATHPAFVFFPVGRGAGGMRPKGTLLRSKAAVDYQFGAGYKFRLLRGKVEGTVRHVFRLSYPVHRMH